MRVPRKHLFSDLDHYQVRHAFESNLFGAIDSLELASLAGVDPNDLIRDLTAKYRMDPPRLKAEETKTQVNDVEVSGVDAWGEPFRGRGLQIDFYVPFEGTPDFFHWTPSSFNYNRPSGSVTRHELCLSYQRLDHDAEAARQQFNSDLANIRTYLDTWATDATSFNASIAALASRRLESKRERSSTHQDFVKKLGFPQK